MKNKFSNTVGSLSLQGALLWGLVLAVVIEIVTVITRFGMGMQATRDTEWLARYTFGLRIHHGYYGVVLLLVCMLLRKGFWKNTLLIVGIGCLISDLIHHFIVLWAVTGDPEFHLVYPAA